MDKESNSKRIVTRSHQGDKVFVSLPVERRKPNSEMAPTPPKQTPEEQLQRLKSEREKIAEEREALQKQKEELQEHRDPADQVRLLQAEKQAQFETIGQFNLGAINQSTEATNRLLGGLINHSQCMQLEIKPPKFSDEEIDNPIEFLNELEKYCKNNSVTEVQLWWVIGSSLTGRAKIWFDIHRSSFNNYEGFKKSFKEEFYSIQYRVKIKNRWSSRRYKSQDGSLGNYFGKQTREAKYFEPVLSQYEINYAVVQQLPVRVRDILATVDFNDTKLVSRALSNLDLAQEERDRYEKSKNSNNYKKDQQSNTQVQTVNSGKVSNQVQTQQFPQQQNYNFSPPVFPNYLVAQQQKFVLPNTNFPPPVLNNPYNFNNSSQQNNSHLN